MPMTKTRNRAEGAAFQEKVVTMRKQGLSFNEIKEALGVSGGTISYYLKKAGVTGKGASKQPHKTVLKHRSNGVVSVLGGPTDTGDSHERTGFAAGFISNWLGNYAEKHDLDPSGLTADVADILRRGKV